MQPFNSRPSLQPTQRPGDGLNRGGDMQMPSRTPGVYRNPADPVERAMMHKFTDSRPVPNGYGHYSQPREVHTPTYASSTQAMFAADAAHTPYEQMYYYKPIKRPREFRFPFRMLMITLVVGAIALSAYAMYRAFTNPSPVNAEYSDQLEVAQ